MVLVLVGQMNVSLTQRNALIQPPRNSFNLEFISDRGLEFKDGGALRGEEG